MAAGNLATPEHKRRDIAVPIDALRKALDVSDGTNWATYENTVIRPDELLQCGDSSPREAKGDLEYHYLANRIKTRRIRSAVVNFVSWVVAGPLLRSRSSSISRS